MASLNRAEKILISEAFLPLLFFSGQQIFYAAAAIPVFAGLTMFALEVLRRQPRAALFSFYLFWLAALGGLGWVIGALPPYWIWSVYLLVPETVWAPSEAQRTRPFLFGAAKYFKRRFFELTGALTFALILAGAVFFLTQRIQKIFIWIAILPALLFFEIARAKPRKERL